MKIFLSLFVFFNLLNAPCVVAEAQVSTASGSSSFFSRVFVSSGDDFHSTPDPASSFDEAIKRFEELQQAESSLPLSPQCSSQLLSHGCKTERVYVLIHGITSCPEQFAALGKIFFDSGANVIIPRAKYAGFSNLLNEQQGEQSGQDLLDQTAEGLDIAAGLGSKITLIGISGGAVSSAWMAEHRDDIDQVLLISPFLGAYGYPVVVSDLIACLFTHMPDYYFWKNKKLKAAVAGPSYAYPQYGTRCIGSTLELGEEVRSFHGALKTNHLAVLYSAFDHVINQDVMKRQVEQWQAENPGKILEYEFPAEMNVSHDCITPGLPGSKIEIVYPKILEMLDISANL